MQSEPGFSGFATWCARLYRPNRAGQWFCVTGDNGPNNGTIGRHWILRTADRSGKGRWVARFVVLALILLAFFLFLLFLGRPIEPRMIEVDVTDKIAQSAPPHRAPDGRDGR